MVERGSEQSESTQAADEQGSDGTSMEFNDRSGYCDTRELEVGSQSAIIFGSPTCKSFMVLLLIIKKRYMLFNGCSGGYLLEMQL